MLELVAHAEASLQGEEAMVKAVGPRYESSYRRRLS